ncbi:MAG: hypothetical protein F6K25_09785 [Okeania sp. SIO2G4]|uniref:hypothetical protein n=1 Tax=unclassified Okeania TaxID=2634635 RepID=UPI0013B79A20|nr:MULTISPECIES: hypothetical protein [unclassified Okeania]NEP07814.1 hypothetical protein [Okeania sp. SIO4D6]NEP39013.1 hypothetical protein [Okeania sp. SIO2H7]NEP72305.1 hypothetical protein [Okeania sp. SIO2G5]NEP94272.1 hypothetical protein [Okeania sp. SIO2F5]NEQ90985.1 hypothetical protein [Okeania sp. SIO2G4]
MDLDQQIQTLIKNSPQNGNTAEVVEAITPALKLLAQQLQHLEYYILQTDAQNWVLTTLGHRNKSELEKRVIYAFPTQKDASSSIVEDNVVAKPVPVVYILFQMIAIEPLDSLVFFEHPGNLTTATEVKREDVQKLISIYLQQYQASSHSHSSKIPPDIA